jgi:hypothetical protein
VLVLVLGLACCLFDGHGPDHIRLAGVCLGMFAAPLAGVSVGSLAAIGTAVIPIVVTAYAVAPHPPDPPPKLALTT